MTVITDEQEGAGIGHIDLHSNQTIRVTRKMVKRDPLAEVECLVVEGLPVTKSKLLGLLLLDLNVSTGCLTYRPSLR